MAMVQEAEANMMAVQLLEVVVQGKEHLLNSKETTIAGLMATITMTPQ